MESVLTYIATTKAPISIERAKDLLCHADKYNCISDPPVKPKAGQIFIFKPKCVEKQGKLSIIAWILQCGLAVVACGHSWGLI